MEKKKKLTPKQIKFCVAYASGKNLTESCTIAGIGSPQSSGSRMLKSANIRRCINEHVENLLTAQGITEHWTLTQLKKVYESAMHSEHWQSAIASLKQISEIGGYSNRVNKSEVKLVASFENLLEKTPLDITPPINGDVHSQDSTSPTFLPPADPDAESDLGQNR